MKTQTRKNISLFAQQALACLCLLIVPSLYAADTTENRGQLTASDHKFVCDAARGGTMEVSLGKVAAEKSADPSIQQFGQRMVQDHGKAGDQLQQLVSQKGATLPSALTKSQQAEVDKLTAQSGQDFDKAYIALMIKDHKATLKEFQHAADHADDADVKSFAASLIPTIQDHLKMAEDMKAGEKVASADVK
jgi:putative membrane protein